MPDLLIRGGTLVTAEKVAQADVLIEGEKIRAVGPDLPRTAAPEVLDVGGLWVLPGLIDPHVHLREPGGTHKEDFTSGTAAALAGGFTTVLAMPNTDPPVVDGSSLRRTISLAMSKAVCDFGLFVGATSDNAGEVAGLVEAAGLKLYMGSSTGSLLVADLAGQMAHFERYPGVIAVHAEDEEAVAYFAARGQRRPPLCAALAVARALVLAGHYRTRLHVCHVSTARELALIRDARARAVPVSCETTPHHLFLSAADEVRLGSLGRMNPPLRRREEVEALWAHLELIDCIATDHAPHTLEEKRRPSPPAGVPGLETALPLMLTAVSEGRLALQQLAKGMAEGPARVFRIAGKGRLAPGYDADVVLVDPAAVWTIGEHPLLTRCGWSPFDGRRVRGRVERVFLRGRLALEEGRLQLEPGSGRSVRRAG